MGPLRCDVILFPWGAGACEDAVHCGVHPGTARLDRVQWGKMVCRGAILYFVAGVCTVKPSLCTARHAEVVRVRSVCRRRHVLRIISRDFKVSSWCGEANVLCGECVYCRACVYIYDKVHLAEWDECLHG